MVSPKPARRRSAGSPGGDSGQHLYIIGMDGGGYAHHAVQTDYDAAAARALHADEDALHAVEGAAVDAHAGAGLQMELVGRKVVQTLLRVRGQGDEVAHLTVGDYDGHAAAGLAPHEVVQPGHGGLGGTHGVGRGADEEQVVHGGQELAHLAAAGRAQHVAHGDKRLQPALLEALLRLERAAVHSAHGPPARAVVCGIHGHVCKVEFWGKAIPLAP